MTTKEQFLTEHNKLSPPNLQATMAMLTDFQEQKKPILSNKNWSIDKLRIPFIQWLLAGKSVKDKNIPKIKGAPKYYTYPREES